MQTFFHSKALQSLPKLGFWFETKPSGNPASCVVHFRGQAEASWRPVGRFMEDMPIGFFRIFIHQTKTPTTKKKYALLPPYFNYVRTVYFN
jgi:hypothetical protein